MRVEHARGVDEAFVVRAEAVVVIRRTLLIIAFSLLTGLTSGCASLGQVVESETGQPIEGAYAVTQWYADLNEIVRSEVVCLRLDVAKTDAAGRFEMPSSSGIVSPMLFNQRRFVILYKAGYKQNGLAEANGSPLTMERDARMGASRIEYLNSLAGGMYCGVDDPQNKASLPVFNAVYVEMQALAPEPTKWEQAMLLEMEFRIESLALGYREAERNLRARKKALRPQLRPQ